MTTDGWTGRASDQFRDKFDSEPERWRDAVSGFERAAGGLTAFADAVDEAKRRAATAADDYARGDQATQDARGAYDADVTRARDEASTLRTAGTAVTLTIVPFNDPGEAIRQQALADYSSAKSDLERAAGVCAAEVRAGCAAAPDKKNWLEEGLSSVGGFFAGAGEAVWGLVTLPGSPISLLQDGYALASGDLTPEEMAARYRMKVETVGDMLDAFKDDPMKFGQELGKGLLDWDTWSDDPARALGRLVPDAVATVFTAGAGAAATRGVKGTADAADALGDMAKLSRLDDLSDLSNLDDVSNASRGLDGLDDLGRLADGPGRPGEVQGPDDVQSWIDDINGADKIDWSDPGERGINCGKCAYAVHERFEGSPDATVGTGTYSVGEMERLTGRPQVPMGPNEIESMLRDQGPGSHTVVGIDRRTGDGHWFNAYFDGDKVYRIDAQTGEVSGWPPTDLGDVSNWDAGVDPTWGGGN